MKKYVCVLTPVLPIREVAVWLDITRDARVADISEWETAGGRPFPDSLRSALHQDHVWTVALGSREAGVLMSYILAFGVQPSTLKGVGDAWLVATNVAPQHYRALRRLFEVGLRQMLLLFPTLHAWADSRNAMHHRWMRAMGFVHAGRTATIGGVPFYLFTYTKDK